MSSWIRTSAVVPVIAIFVASLLVLSPVARSTVSAATVEREQAVVDEMYCIKASLIVGCSESRFQTVEAEVGGTLIAVELYIGRQAAMTEDLVIEIREGLNDGPLLATSNPVPASDLLILPEASLIRFTFDEPATVRVRDVFSIVVPPVSAGGDADWAWGGTSENRPADLYPAGSAWGCYGGPCLLHGFDHAFVTHVEGAPDTAAPQSGPPEGAAEPAEPAFGERDDGQSGRNLATTAAIVGLVAVAALFAGYWVARRRNSP